jgi:nucleoside-diphosphate-sugar epimerase
MTQISEPSRTVLVTGATGFVGSRLINSLAASGRYSVRATARNCPIEIGKKDVITFNLDLTSENGWDTALSGVGVVVHTAARVHVMNEVALDPMKEFRRVNVAGTLRLAKLAQEAGVKRFIYLSSIKVNGEKTQGGIPFTSQSEPKPNDPYGISKLEAELGLKKIAAESNMEVVIIRPPLVYGPGVKANFRSLISTVSRLNYLPFGNIQNLRSFVGVDNLIDLIVTCTAHPDARNKTFLVSDGQDVSTPELLMVIAKSFNKRLYLLTVPTSFLKLVARSLGKKDAINRLCESLQIDMQYTFDILRWSPIKSIEAGIKEVVDHYVLETKP